MVARPLPLILAVALAALAVSPAPPALATDPTPTEIHRPVVAGVLGSRDHPVEPLPILQPGPDWSPPGHVADEAALAEAKRRVLWDPTIPAGRDIGEAGVGGGPAPLTPGLRRRFDGVRFDETFRFPPDTIVAASSTTVIEAVNSALQITDRDGRDRRAVSFEEFFGDDGNLFDPKLYFDPLSDRFFLVVVELSQQPQQSFVHLAVSRTPSPAGFGSGEWCRYFINSRRNGAWADYPGLGMNERWLVVSANNFRFAGSFQSPFLYVIDKGELLPNGEVCPRATFTGFRPPDGFTIQPAQHATASAAAGDPIYLVSTRSVLVGGSSSTYDLWTVRDDGTGPVLESAAVTGSFNYAPTPVAPQLGGDDIDTGDARVTHAVFRDGVVWAVHATGCDIGDLPNESCIRVVGIDPANGAPSITFEETFGNLDWHAYWPGIAVNTDGDVVVAFQRSRGDRFLDFAYTGKRGTSVQFAPTRTFKIGQCALFLDFDAGKGRIRSGDYVGLQVDPLDDRSFWLAGEYSSRMSVFGCGWATTIGRTAYAAAPPAAPAPLATGSAPGDGAPGPDVAPDAVGPRPVPRGRPGRLQRDEGPGGWPIDR